MRKIEMQFVAILTSVLLLLNPAAVAAQEPKEDQSKEQKLPSSISDVCVGGGGRFLILHLPKERKLAVFDTHEAKVVKYLPTGSDAKFAAGFDKLLVVLPNEKIIQRWSLKTFEREAAARIPVDGNVIALSMGSASHGPLYVGMNPEGIRSMCHFIDPATLKAITLKLPPNRQLPGGGAYVRAAADGSVFTMRNGIGGEPHSVSTIVFHGEKSAVVHEGWIGGSVLVPSTNGRYIYTSGAVYTDRIGLVYPRVAVAQSPKSYLPALHGNYFMRLDFKEWDKLGGSLAFFLEGSETPFAQLANIAGVSNEQIAYGTNRDRLTPDQRIFFIPEAKRVISIPNTDDRLLLHDFDLVKELDKSGIDYIVVTSRPNTRAIKGEAYRYEIAFKSKKDAKCSLEAGPDGMKGSADGKLTWAVPKEFDEATVDVIVKVTDSARQEVFHTFKIAVKDRADAP